ncbi:ABC transporter permease [Blastococcus sp. BMG 814]|uniref:ABC transporter permease n=1 Tax=Blastococcus carthaginiensis TaxID=3050034 RepID=A0ABT9IDG0_9ACTN|nr:ABC transporter permease [Blastococcus carthaginiensis]MDP5183626.1 ABC transporter permease [Blastococcus carthaginiensis]
MTVAVPELRAPRTRLIRRHPVSAVLAGGFLLLIVIMAVFAPLLAPHSPTATSLTDALLPPGSPDHLLGTDSTGRDILSRLMYGARLSLLGPLGVVLLATVAGVAVGLAAARGPGWADLLLTRAMDIVFAFPGLLLAMLVVAVFGPGLLAPMCALAIAYTPFVGRVVRSLALQEAARPYVDSYSVMGFGRLFVTVRHILPNLVPVLAAQAALAFGYALVDLATLSFLGLGVRPPQSDWGSMISQAQPAILQGQPWSAIIPGITVLLTVVAVNILGEHLGSSVARAGERS